MLRVAPHPDELLEAVGQLAPLQVRVDERAKVVGSPCAVTELVNETRRHGRDEVKLLTASDMRRRRGEHPLCIEPVDRPVGQVARLALDLVGFGHGFPPQQKLDSRASFARRLDLYRDCAARDDLQEHPRRPSAFVAPTELVCFATGPRGHR